MTVIATDSTIRRGDGRLSISPRRAEVARVVSEIDELCTKFGVGARIPAHRDLMHRFATTERTVLRALTELQRRGRIVRRAGSGTYVAQEPITAPIAKMVPGLSPADPAPLPRIGHDRPRNCDSIVVVAPHDNAFFSQGIGMAYDRAIKLGLPVSYEPPTGERLMEYLEDKEIGRRGFVIFGGKYYDLCKKLHDSGARVAHIGGPPPNTSAPFPCVNADQFRGGYLAVEHLIGLGHRHVASVEPTNWPRHRGHMEAISTARGAGLSVRFSSIPEEQWRGWNQRPDLAIEYFSAPDHPTGLCAWNDHDCISLLTILQSQNIRVPDQVSLVGFDNGRESRSVMPALTTIDNKLEDRIRIAIELLLNCSSDVPPFMAMVQPELIVRASTKKQY